MKKYLSFIGLRFRVSLQYRFAAVAGIATQVFFAAMFLLIYEAYYRTGIDAGMEWQQLVSYLWLGQAFYYLTYFNVSDTDISQSIVTRPSSVRTDSTSECLLDVVWQNLCQ